MIRDDKQLREKANFYKSKNSSVHIILKSQYQIGHFRVAPTFRNGLILNIKEEYIELKEEKLGEIIIFFSEILNIEKREEKR